MFTLHAPYFLFLLPLPLLLYWLKERQGRMRPRVSRTSRSGFPPPALLHSQTAELSLLHEQRRNASRQRPPWIWLTACTLLIFALSQPRWLEPVDSYELGRDFMLALDVSGSMRALDFVIDGKPASRLSMLKHVVRRFVDEHRHDQIGVIAFADDAHTVVPMTTDMRTLTRFLASLDNGLLGEKTALGEAVALAVKRLRNRPSPRRILVLLTDGTNTSGGIDPENALDMAKYYGVRIHTVGIGRPGQVAFPRGPSEPVEMVELPVDKKLLQHLAQETGGRYFQVSTTTDLETVADAIDRLEQVPVVSDQVPYQEWYWLPLGASLLLVFLDQIRKPARILPA